MRRNTYELPCASPSPSTSPSHSRWFAAWLVKTGSTNTELSALVASGAPAYPLGTRAREALLSPNGFRSSVWGPLIFWPVLHGWCQEDWVHNLPAALVRFFLSSPAYLLPCVYCRRSYLEYISQEENDLVTCVACRQSPEARRAAIPSFMARIHNCVNAKLGKQEFRGPCDSMLNSFPWRSRFWDYVFLQALDYPLNVSAEVREFDRHVARRYRTCVLFFELLKDWLPDSTLRRAWMKALLMDPPTPLTFASRTGLVEWLYRMYEGAHRPLAPCRSERETVAGKRVRNRNGQMCIPSLDEALERYGELRATSCSSIERPGETGCT